MTDKLEEISGKPPATQKDYFVVEEDDLLILMQKVERYLRDGWVLVGSCRSYVLRSQLHDSNFVFYYQTLVRNLVDKEEATND